MTIDELITTTERDKTVAEQRRSAAQSKFRALTSRATADGRKNLTAAEETRADELAETISVAAAEVAALTNKLAGIRAAAGEEKIVDQQLNTRDPNAANVAAKPAYDRVARVGSEPHQYRAPTPGRHRDDDEPSFLRDLYATQILRDPAAASRLERHGNEVVADNLTWTKRAIGSGAVSGFVPPQYLSELFAEYARAGRPLANLCTPMPLPPEGMTLNVPRITTSTTTAVQPAEGGAIGNQDPDDTLINVPVVTIGGYVDTSRQAIERGTLVEELLFADLAADYNARLDSQLISGSGSAGQHMGVLTVAATNAIAYADASPTIPELWPKLADAVGKVISQRYTGPTAMVSHPNLWAWLLAERDTTGRPMFEPSSVAFNPLGTLGPQDYTATAQGQVLVPFVADGNVPTNLGGATNETRIIVADFRDLYLFEDGGSAPAQLRFDQPLSSTLQIRLVAYGYSAFASGRQPKAISIVSGTGLIVPAL
jgi:HK97 family phage major capsid protein